MFEPLPDKLLQRELRSLAIIGSYAITIRSLPPSLETLRLRAADLEHNGPIAWNIRELEVALNAPVAARLEAAQLPKLERLVIVDCGRTVALDTVLASMTLPALRQLGIDGGEVAAPTFASLAQLPFARHLTSLALTDLGLDDDSIRSIVHTCRSLPALRQLDVSDNELSREGLALVRELPVDVISRRQSKRGSNTERRIRRFAGSRMHVAEEIADPKAWRHAGEDGNLRWARYRGDDEYELYVSTDLERYACTCPSSIQPCKHVVALALVAERNGLPSASDHALVERVRARHPWLNEEPR